MTTRSTISPDGGIVLSYLCRDAREGAGDHVLFVHLLTQELADHFGADNVVTGTSTDRGDGYPDEPRTRFASCDVLLVIIHPHWLDDLTKWRAGSPSDKADAVHDEIRNALRRGHRNGDQPARRRKVIPVLLDEADPPRSDELPEDLRELAFLQAFRLRFGSLDQDIARLVTELEIHALPSWPPVPVADQETSAGRADRKAVGHSGARWPVAILFASAVVAFAPAGDGELASPPPLALWSAMSITVTFLAMAAATLLARPLRQLERHLYSRPGVWLLTVRLGSVATVLTLFQPFLPALDGAQLLIALGIAIPGTFILLFYIFDLGIRDNREDSRWPPTVTIRQVAICRAIARLEHHLVSLWNPPLSRIQHDQAHMVIQQLRDAVVALRTLLERTRSRRDWLRTTCPRLAAGYAVWLAATLGLAIASTQQRLSPQDYPNWHLALPVGVLSCALGIATLELFFRHHRSTLHWLIEETENDIDSRLACHLRGDRTDRR